MSRHCYGCVTFSAWQFLLDKKLAKRSPNSFLTSSIRVVQDAGYELDAKLQLAEIIGGSLMTGCGRNEKLKELHHPLGINSVDFELLCQLCA
eukprot:1160444-Pelagomonas_calceolata.AAC.8